VIVLSFFQALISYFVHVLVVGALNRVLSFALVYFRPKEPFQLILSQVGLGILVLETCLCWAVILGQRPNISKEI
jgi:hypothetical protein